MTAPAAIPFCFRASAVFAIAFATLVGVSSAGWAESPAEAARRIVKNPRYQRAFPSTEPVTRRPTDQATPRLPSRPWQPPAASSPDAASGLVEGLGLVLAGVAGGAAVVAAWRAMARWRRRTTGPTDDRRVPVETPRPGLEVHRGDDAIGAARRLGAEGRHEEAVLLLWQAAMHHVGGETAAGDAHLTGRELLAALKNNGQLADADAAAGLVELLRAMEAARFARRRTVGADVERCVAAFLTVRKGAGAAA